MDVAFNFNRDLQLNESEQPNVQKYQPCLVACCSKGLRQLLDARLRQVLVTGLIRTCALLTAKIGPLPSNFAAPLS